VAAAAALAAEAQSGAQEGNDMGLSTAAAVAVRALEKLKAGIISEHEYEAITRTPPPAVLAQAEALAEAEAAAAAALAAAAISAEEAALTAERGFGGLRPSRLPACELVFAGIDNIHFQRL